MYNYINRKDIVTLTLAGISSPYLWSWIMSFMYGKVFNHYLYSENLFLLVGLLASALSTVLILLPFVFFLKQRSLLHGIYFIVVFLITTLLMMYTVIGFMEYKENVSLFFRSPNTWLFMLFSVLFLWCPWQGVRLFHNKPENSKKKKVLG